MTCYSLVFFTLILAIVASDKVYWWYQTEEYIWRPKNHFLSNETSFWKSWNLIQNVPLTSGFRHCGQVHTMCYIQHVLYPPELLREACRHEPWGKERVHGPRLRRDRPHGGHAHRSRHHPAQKQPLPPPPGKPTRTHTHTDTRIHTDQSWAFVIFLNLFNNKKKIFFAFFVSS